MLIVTSQQMKEIEQSAIEFDITIPRLMENAGSAAAAFVRKVFPVGSLNCVIFCGNGNNGGDGFVVARRLSENGAKVVVVLVDGPSKSEPAAQMFDSLKTFEIPILTISDNRALIESYALHADLIVDAVYGISFHGDRLPTPSLIACQIINDAPAAVVSLDIPSGIEADRGTVAFSAVKADFTVVFQLLKPAHMLPLSKNMCGDIHTVEIGIPDALYKNIDSHFSFIESKRVFQFLPPRRANAHKGTFGRLLAICGSNNYRGAATLASSGAFSTGVGSLCLAAPEVVCSSLMNHLLEATVAPLPTTQNGSINFDLSLPILESEMKKSNAILFGCGSSRDKSTVFILDYLLSKAIVPLILDADALDLLAENLSLLSSTKADVILTPHPGEMAKLAGMSVADVQQNRITTALDFSVKHKVTVVLKGPDTLVALKNGKLRINSTGGPELARAGSGDILAGMIASFSSQGINTSEACSMSVWLHGEAGQRCSKRLSQRSMLPSDILTDIGQIFLEHETNKENVTEISL